MKWILQNADGSYPGKATDGLRLPRDRQELLTMAHWESHLKAIQECPGKERVFSNLSNTERERLLAPEKRLEELVKDVRAILSLVSDSPEPDDDDDDSSGSEEIQQDLMLYRAMSNDECKKILGWSARMEAFEALLNSGALSDKTAKDLKKDFAQEIIPISGHLGDYAQAREYNRTMKGYERLVRFTLKPGAHKILFDPVYAVFGHGSQTHLIETCIRNAGEKKDFFRGSDNEGAIPGYIGMKCEKGGTAFSLAMGKSAPTHFLFQLLIARVEDITDEQASTSTNSTSTNSTRATSSATNSNN